MKDTAKAIAYAGLFAIPCIVLIISNDLFFPFITGKNFTFRILVEIVFAAWIILVLYDAQYRPRFSAIVASFLAFLGVMLVANIFGQNPSESFWSNFERMEGYVTLVHVFMYMIVAGTLLTTQKLWHRYFNVIIGVAVILAFYAFAQLSGNVTIHQGGWRLDGTLGNSAYMAVYMLFLSFITLYMLLQAKSRGAKYGYGALVLLFVFLLIQTATRGTIIGLVGGALVTAGYIALFSREYPQARKAAMWGLGAVAVIIALFVTFKESSFIQTNPYLERVASISLGELQNRINIWSMAFEGVKERPLLGWGQSNYNFVFNEYYRPELHAGEAWFDRVHNIFMDWLIAGGVLGMVAYFSILFSALYYLFVRPLMREDASFSTMERGVLLGLLAGYFIHNLVVFDNIVSYIFYGTILAFIHARVATPVASLQAMRIDSRLVGQIGAPVIVVVCAFVIYAVNVPNIQAAEDIIRALRSQDPRDMLREFDRALSRDTFGKQEIREQLAQRAQALRQTEGVNEEIEKKVAQRAEEELLLQIEEKPGDARSHVVLGSFYRLRGEIEKAREQLKIARDLSPRKQLIIFEQGYTELQAGRFKEGLAFFKEAYDLGPQFMDSRVRYATAAVFAGEYALMEELIQSDEEKRAFADSVTAQQAVFDAKLYPQLLEMLSLQMEMRPEDVQIRLRLAYILYESGDVEGSIDVIEKAAIDIPSFAKDAPTVIENIRAGRVGTDAAQ